MCVVWSLNKIINFKIINVLIFALIINFSLFQVCTAFGLTYNGKDSSGNLKWDGCANVELLTFENATQYDHYIQSFNINTNHWSAEYVYKRLKFLGSKLYSQIATLAFLAVWHGFHSGYYMCFIMEFIIMYFEKDVSFFFSYLLKLNKF